MANRQAKVVGLDTFKGEGRTASDLPGVPAPSGAEAYQASAREFAQLSTLLNAWADDAARREGREEGIAAALESGDTLPRRKDGTLRGEAFDKAAIDVFATRFDAALRNDMFAIGEKHQNDPAAMKAAFDELEAKKRGEVAGRLGPEMTAHFDKRFADYRFPYEKSAERAASTRLRADAAASNVDAITTAFQDVQRKAYLLGGDGEGDEMLAADSERIRRMIENAKASGYITPAAAINLHRNLDNDIALNKVKGAFDRLEGLDAKQAFLDKLNEDWAAGRALKGVDTATFQKHVTDMARGLRAEQAVVKQGEREINFSLQSIAQRAVAGQAVATEEWTELDRLATRVKQPALVEALSVAKAQVAEVQKWWAMSPRELDLAIRAERARLSREPNEADSQRLKTAESVLAAMSKEIKNDLISFSERTNRIAPTMLDPLALTNPEALPQKFAQRLAAATLAAENAGVPVQYFNKAERAAWTDLFNKGGEPAAVAAAAFARHWGASHAQRAIAEIAPKAGVMATAAAVAAAGGSQDFLTDVARARQMAGQQGYKPIELRRPAVDAASNDEFGAAFSAAPASRVRAVDAAKAAYDARAREQGFSADIAAGNPRREFRRALQEAAGASFEGGVQYGGVASHNGRKTVVPTAIQAARFGDVIAAIKDEDLAANPPLGANGQPLRASDLRSARLVAIGDGKYRAARGDPDGERPQWFAGKDGEPWVLDMHALEPVLKTRRGDLYRGGAGSGGASGTPYWLDFQSIDLGPTP